MVLGSLSAVAAACSVCCTITCLLWLCLFDRFCENDDWGCWSCSTTGWTKHLSSKYRNQYLSYCSTHPRSRTVESLFQLIKCCMVMFLCKMMIQVAVKFSARCIYLLVPIVHGFCCRLQMNCQRPTSRFSVLVSHLMMHTHKVCLWMTLRD